MEMLDKRLNDKGKNWRHVFKVWCITRRRSLLEANATTQSLTVLDYCLHQGSENVVIYFRDNLYVIKTLKEFQYIDEEGKDQGANVRQKAKDITNLLQDENRLRQERRTRASMRDRMIRGAGGDAGTASLDIGTPSEAETRKMVSRGRNKDEDDLKKAIEESKRTLRQEQLTAEERELQEALKMSEEEEARRAKAVEDSNSNALFDDQQQLYVPAMRLSRLWS